MNPNLDILCSHTVDPVKYKRNQSLFNFYSCYLAMKITILTLQTLQFSLLKNQMNL